MNRHELRQAAQNATRPCLAAKGYVAPIDVLIAMGTLNPKEYEQWRLGKIPYLEKVLHANPKRLVEILRAVRDNSIKGGLKPSWTAYMKWGKGPRRRLRFTKTGNTWIEELYATQYIEVQSLQSKEQSGFAGPANLRGEQHDEEES